MGKSQVMTVSGFVDAEQLGTVYAHEHLIVQPQISEDRKRPILMRSDTKLPQPFASWSNSL